MGTWWTCDMTEQAYGTPDSRHAQSIPAGRGWAVADHEVYNVASSYA